jgi:hypothetical protein
VEFISLPGFIAGQVTLYDGLTVDAVVPDLRGMYSWNSRRYIDALAEEFRRQNPGAPGADGAPGDDAAPPRRDPVTERINRFLSKTYFRIRNRGLAPEERALNAAATNAFT